nr:insulinase family protein [uncultured Cellulosilyticum sp.]
MLKRCFFIMLAAVLVTTNCYGQAENLKNVENTKITSQFKEYAKERHGKDVLHKYVHQNSGLEVIWIENDDTNKSFTLGVRTPTVDSTGVNHIIEHTLFTGSKKYPSSSLFFDASSSYPNIYMNALTSGDMTIFPFATPYMTCYKALLDIYLDSIFNPDFLNQPYGFYEESFNYAPEEERSGGVVYNEMKGAYGNEDRKIYRTVRQTVYRDTLYSHDSGGDPNEIPKLTYQQFIDTYNRYYYPGNMRVVLYGQLPIEEVLEIIETYLHSSKEPRENISLEVKTLQVPKMVKSAVLNPGSKCAIAKSFVMPHALSVEEEVQMDLWINAYLGSRLSPMQQTLQKLGCQEIKILKDDDLPYMMYTLVVKNIPREKLNLYNAILDEVLLKISESREEAMEEDVLLEAKWGQMQNEEDEERSIFIPQTILDGWAHGKDESQYYKRKEYVDQIKAIKKEACRALWQEASMCTFFLTPGQMQIEDPLTLTQLTKEEWRQVKKQMTQWQGQKCNLEGVPLEELVLDENLSLKETAKGEYTLLTTKAQTEFARSQLYYETGNVKQEDLPYLFLYSYLLEESGREQTPFKGILKTNCIALPNEEAGYKPYFKITMVTPKEEKEHGEILEEARANLLSQDASWYEYKLKKFINGSQAASQNNVLGTLGNLGLGGAEAQKRYLYEQGYPFYEFCKACLKEQGTAWIEKVKQMDQSVYQTNGLVVAITSPYKSSNGYLHSLKKIIKEGQKNESLNRTEYKFEQMPKTSFLQLDTAVDYIYIQNTLKKPVEGSDFVAAAYMAKNYFNPKIRIGLGAYGAGCNCQYPTTFNIYTYRDPDFKHSLQVIAESGEFLDKTPINEAALKASQTEALTRVHQQFRLLDKGLEQVDVLEVQFLLGNKKNVVKNLQAQILDTTGQKMQQKACIFKDLLREGTLSIATKKLPQNVTGHKIYQFK